MPSTPRSLGSPRNSPPQLSWAAAWCSTPQDRTYRVVSWLMLVKELLRELILLLLRSLENRNPRAWSQLGPACPRYSPACPAAMGCEQHRGTVSKGAAGLPRRVMAAMPLSCFCPAPSASRGCEHPGPERCCQPVVSQCRGGAQRDVRGPCTLPGLSRTTYITYHRDSLCPLLQVPVRGPAGWTPAPGYLHKLQILEGGELPWNLSELISIQVAARENKNTSEW